MQFRTKSSAIGWSEEDNAASRAFAAAHVQGVWAVTSQTGALFEEVYLTQEEATWLAWSLSYRNTMWRGISFAECTVRYVERFIPNIHQLGNINLNINKIDPEMKFLDRKAGPGNYKVIETKSFRDQLRRDTLNAIAHSQTAPENLTK